MQIPLSVSPASAAAASTPDPPLCVTPAAADLATHRAECSSSDALALTVRDVTTAVSLPCAERGVASASGLEVRR